MVSETAKPRPKAFAQSHLNLESSFNLPDRKNSKTPDTHRSLAAKRFLSICNQLQEGSMHGYVIT